MVIVFKKILLHFHINHDTIFFIKQFFKNVKCFIRLTKVTFNIADSI